MTLGINYNIQDNNGQTPLHWACFYHYANVDPKVYVDIVEFLLKHSKTRNIKPDATDFKGRTPEDLARLRDYHAVSNLFKKLKKT